jgi:uncharacterized protein (TIGR02284 family)
MAVEISQDELLFTLNELIETCIDGRNGFLEAAQHATDSHLKEMCAEYSRQRAQFASQLQDEVRRLGGNPDEKGTVAGTLHRRWMDVKAAVVGRDDDAIIAECERGEDVAVERYGEALAKKLPALSREIVEAQSRQVKQAHDRFRDLKRGGSGG